MKILPSKDEIIPMMIVAVGTAMLVQFIKAKFPAVK
jgi:hypothetical protein